MFKHMSLWGLFHIQTTTLVYIWFPDLWAQWILFDDDLLCQTATSLRKCEQACAVWVSKEDPKGDNPPGRAAIQVLPPLVLAWNSLFWKMNLIVEAYSWMETGRGHGFLIAPWNSLEAGWYTLDLFLRWKINFYLVQVLLFWEIKNNYYYM